MDLVWACDLLVTQGDVLRRVRDETGNMALREAININSALKIMMQKAKEDACKTQTKSND